MANINFPVNRASPLIEIPSSIPQIGFLGGSEGKEIDDSIKKDYKEFEILQIGNYSENLVKCSSPFYNVAVQSRLPSNVRVASQSDLEKAIKLGSLELRGTFEDTSLALRTEEDPNSYLAEDLMNQVKQRLGKKAKMPVMILLYGLKLAKDQNSKYGLSFKLKDNAEIIYAPILNEESGNFAPENIIEKIGLPKKLGKGVRTLCTRSTGLSRLYLNRDLYLGSSNNNLAGSIDDGRVVLVLTSEAGSQDFFQSRLKNLETQRDEEIEKINERYIQAKQIMEGK